MGAGAAERPGGAGGRDRAAQPLRQPDHRRPRRGPPAARAQSRAPAAPPPTSTPPRVRASPAPTSRGTARRWSTRAATCSAETERFPDGPAPPVADVDLDRLRQERLRQGTFDDNRRALADDHTELPRRRVRAHPPQGDIGLRRKVDRFPFVPDDAERLALDCYEAYNIQVSGLEQRLRAIGQPKVVIGVCGGLDSTHALIVAAKAMDRLGRPRTDIHAFTHARLRDGRDHQGQRDAARQGPGRDVRGARHPARRASRCSTDLDHPFADGEQVYDVTFENVQAGLRNDYLFRLANHRGGIVLGTGDLSELALGWCTYGVGDQMSHYAVNAGVPKTLIQHLIRWVIDSEQFGEADDEVNAVLTEIVEPGDHARAGPDARRARSRSRPRRRSAPTPCRTSRCSTCCAAATGRARSRSWPGTPGRDASTGEWPPGLPRGRPHRVRPRRRSGTGSRCSSSGSSPASSSARRCRTARRCAPGGTMSPRGDWRMPSDAGRGLAGRARERPAQLTGRRRD